jgi:hypothetical protein
LIVHPDVRKSARVTAVTRYLRQVIQANDQRLKSPRSDPRSGRAR